MHRIRAWIPCKKREDVTSSREWRPRIVQHGDSDHMEEEAKPRSPLSLIGGILLAFAFLYLFLVALQLLGDAFTCLGGRGAGRMFNAVSNPLTGLMIGVLSTVLVQSSSTTTSVIVGLVGAGILDVHRGIPVIMGANIGTSITNTMVSFAQSADSVALHRAFSGATVHDVFNILSVSTLLPLELIIGAIQGEGGPLYWLTKVFTDIAMSNGEKSEDVLKGKSPTKIITAPLAATVIKNNKYIINALALAAPVAKPSTWVNETMGCAPLGAGRRLHAPVLDPVTLETEFSSAGHADSEAGVAARLLLTHRRLDGSDAIDCSQHYCVSKDLDKALEKIDESAYATLTQCEGRISAGDIQKCEDHVCYIDVGEYYSSHVTHRQIIGGGFTKGAGDIAGGVVALLLSLLMLVGSLVCLCKVLSFLFLGAAKRCVLKAAQTNSAVSVLAGLLMTIVVQSSSVTTAAMTPLCGLGLLPLETMFAITVGANLGTTVTALIASLASFTEGAVHIALCHVFFNFFGISIWFAMPWMRRVPLKASKLLGLYAASYRIFPVIYMFVVFGLLPLACLLISLLYDVSLMAGLAVTWVLLLAFAGFEFWWLRLGGCYQVLPEDTRRGHKAELSRSNRRVRAAQAANVARAADTEVAASGQRVQV